MRKLLAGVVAIGAAVVPALGQAVMVDSALPRYTKVEGVSGTAKSMGSDTMNNLMTLWGEALKKHYPNIKIEIEGKGSSTAPAALIESQAQFGPMSRPMKDSEIDKFEKAFGYKPTGLATAIDCLAVYVHKDNPIKSLTVEQVRQIFSVTGPEMKWGELGLTGAWANQPVTLYGRNSASGTYGYFKEHVLKNSDFKPTVKEQPGSSSVVQAVATDKFGIGYSGIGYKTADVRAVPIAVDNGPAFEANVENAYSGDYPIARYLYVYVNYKPGSQLDPLRREFIRLIYTQEGQEVTIKDGYIPIPADTAREELKKVGITPNF